MNIYLCDDLYEYSRLIDPDLFYYRLLLKTLMENPLFKDILKMLLHESVELTQYNDFRAFEQQEGKVEYYYIDVIKLINHLDNLGFSPLCNFNNAVTVWKSLYKTHSHLPHNIFDRGVIACLIAEAMEYYENLLDEYYMEGEKEYVDYQNFVGDANEKLYAILADYVGRENKNWWLKLTGYFP